MILKTSLTLSYTQTNGNITQKFICYQNIYLIQYNINQSKT